MGAEAPKMKGAHRSSPCRQLRRQGRPGVPPPRHSGAVVAEGRVGLDPPRRQEGAVAG